MLMLRSTRNLVSIIVGIRFTLPCQYQPWLATCELQKNSKWSQEFNRLRPEIRADSRSGVLGQCAASPFPTARGNWGMESAVSFPARSGAPLNDFPVVWDFPATRSATLRLGCIQLQKSLDMAANGGGVTRTPLEATNYVSRGRAYQL